MLKKIKNFIKKTDRFLFEKFGSAENIKYLENLKEAKIIFSYLNEIGNDSKVKFVGGCIRKAMCGEEIDDIDLATTLEPSEVKKRLNKNNIKVVDTGILHGTLTAIINKKKFEITTLRKDISTDGRHAEVTFTTNWQEDSQRRDLTINSIYADIDGQIYDPQNGISDLKNRKINFIGDPQERIQEDYLRILRYFRFFTQYGKKDHDKNVIKAIRQNINGINIISNERIFDEVKKTLSLKNVYNLFSNKDSKEIILNIFPQFKFYNRLKNFNNLKEETKNKYDYKNILALLCIDETDNYEFFCYKYKLSNRIKDNFKFLSKNFKSLKNKKFYSENNIKKIIYLYNKNIVRDILLFIKCSSDNLQDFNLENLLNYVGGCKVPEFPISGEHLKKHGFKTGEELGKKLKSLEQKWIDNNFVIDANLSTKYLN